MANIQPKRIILILGGKGGTGKTLFCRLVYYYLLNAQVNCLAFDADTENPEFAEYHSDTPHPVKLLDFLDVGEAKRLFTELEQTRPQVALLDPTFRRSYIFLKVLPASSFTDQGG